MFFIHSHMMRGLAAFAPKSCESLSIKFPCKLSTIFLITIVCKSRDKNFSGVHEDKMSREVCILGSSFCGHIRMRRILGGTVLKLEDCCCVGIVALIWAGPIKKQSVGSITQMCLLNHCYVLGNVYRFCITDCTAHVLKNIGHKSH